MKKIIIAAVVVILVGIGTWLYFVYKKNKQTNELVLYGNVDVRQVEIGFRVPGKVAELFFEEGDDIPVLTHIAAVCEDAHEGHRDALGGRRGARPGRTVEARRVALVDDLAVVDDEEADGHLILRLAVEGPLRGGLKRGPVDAVGQRLVRDEVAHRPGDGVRVAGRGRQVDLGEGVDVGEGLVRRHHHASDALAEGGPDRGRVARPTVAPDRDRATLPVDHVVAALGGADGVAQVGELLLEDLVERAVRGEEPVAHEDRLDPVLDHVPVPRPVVEVALLLGGDGGWEEKGGEKEGGEEALHRVLTWWVRRSVGVGVDWTS